MQPQSTLTPSTKRIGRPPGPRVDRTCRQCGKVDLVRPVDLRQSFCSRSCARSSRAIPAEIRVWALIDKHGPDECWPWTAARDKDGYGLFTTGSGKQTVAHRFILQLQTGPLPAHIKACHTCDHPWCCNPAHLFPGSNADNMADMVDKGRSLTGERHPGRKLTDDEVRDIRMLWSEGWSQSAIARHYGMNQTTIGDIVHRHYWSHIQ